MDVSVEVKSATSGDVLPDVTVEFLFEDGTLQTGTTDDQGYVLFALR